MPGITLTNLGTIIEVISNAARFSFFLELSGFAHYLCIFPLLLIYRTEGGKTERMKLKKIQLIQTLQKEKFICQFEDITLKTL